MYYDRLQSYASCLRNLTIPLDNKPLLIAAGLDALAVALIKEPAMGVQFKVGVFVGAIVRDEA